jgi:glyoxylase-like metal-dependent hydrolase (beta-lactamase superfamily II)
MSMQKLVVAVGVAVVVAAMVSWSAVEQPKPPATPRIYVFDDGTIKGLDPKLFNFTRDELKEVDFGDHSYLIVHPRGTLMWDSGEIPDSAFKADGAPVTQGIMAASKPLLPQLAAAGYKPADITYFAMSHYHSDHTGNANAFAGSTWIVQKAERDVLFGDKPPGIMAVDTFSALKGSKTKILNGEDFDVFGDGTVVIMSTPGHTPGHQVLAVKLAKAGTIVLAGDLYHYPEERATGKTPTFEFNAEQSKASRAKIEKFVKDNNAKLWIEHDIATHAALPKPPQYVD